MDPSSRIFFDVKGDAFSSFHLAHIEVNYKLPPVQVMITEDWIKGINIDPLEYAKKIVVPRKHLRHKVSGEYESQSLRTPFRIIDLLLSWNFWQS